MGSSTSAMALVQCLNRLHSETEDDATFREDNHGFWRQLFTTPFSQADVHSVVSTDAARLLMHRHPQRVAMLLYKCISQLYSFVWRQQQQGEQSGLPVGSSLAVVNSLIILGRWLPIILSDERSFLNSNVVEKPTPLPSNTASATFAEAAIEMSTVETTAAAPSNDASTKKYPHFLQWFFRENRVSPGVVTDGGREATNRTERDEANRFPDLLCHERERQDKDERTRCPSALHIPASAASGGQAPLHLVLVHCLVHVCFVPGFTIPERRAPPPAPSPHAQHSAGEQQSTSTIVVMDPSVLPPQTSGAATRSAANVNGTSPLSQVIPRLLWAKGLGDLTGENSEALDAVMRWRRTANTRTITSNRLLVMQTLLVLLSRPLYGTNAILRDDLFTVPLTRSVPLFATLTASLVNYAVSYNPRGTLPYSSHFISDDEHLMVLCVQVLALSLDYSPLLQDESAARRSSSSQEEGSAEASETTASSAVLPHNIPLLLSQRHHGWHTLYAMQPDEAEHVVTHFTPLFTNVTYSLSTFLPNSQRRLLEHEEVLILLYKLVDRCPSFLHAVVQHPMATEYVVPLCYYLTRVLHEPEKASVAHVALFIVSRLAQERHFVLKCNAVLRNRSIPFPTPDFKSPDGSATYSDFLLVTLCSILQFKDLHHDGMCQLCATTIANITPYCTSISLGASQRLVWQLELYGRARFLAEDVSRRGFVLMLLLEAVASLLQYQYRGSSHLAYVLVRTDAALRNVLSLLRAPCRPPELVNVHPETAPVRLHHQHDLPLPATGAAAGATDGVTAEVPSAAAGAVGASRGAVHRHIDLIAAHNGDLLHPQEALERYERVMSAIECALNELLAVAVPLLQSAALAELPKTLANDTTLVGSLPVPHVLITRRSPVTFETDEWMSKVLWGFVFTHTAPGTLAPYGAKDVALFELRAN